MASAPLRPRSAHALTTATALAASTIASLTCAAPTLAAQVVAAPAPAAPARPEPAPTVPAPAQAAPAIPAPDPPTPICGTSAGSDFPLDTRLHGGPADYVAGGAFREWKLDLTNTTDASCSGIHPVLVLTDRARALRPEQIRFEFYDDGSARWWPVAFEVTEAAENVGAFTGTGTGTGTGTTGTTTGTGATGTDSGGTTGFGGFAVPAGRTLTVPVRLAFRAGTAPDEVVVNAAVVQRRGADGDWVGESGDYRLTIGPATTGSAEPVPDTPDPADPSRPPGTAPSPPGSVPRGTEAPVLAGVDRELARTGRESEGYALLLAPLAAALVLLGAVLLRSCRRPRNR